MTGHVSNKYLTERFIWSNPNNFVTTVKQCHVVIRQQYQTFFIRIISGSTWSDRSVMESQRGVIVTNVMVLSRKMLQEAVRSRQPHNITVSHPPPRTWFVALIHYTLASQET